MTRGDGDQVLTNAQAPRSALLVPMALAVAVAHLLAARGYGYFRDEFYYVACGEHLALGYVDHPPLIALVSAAVTSTLGHSLYALRLVPALAAGALFWLTGAVAAELGGGRFAQLAGALTLLLAPVILALFSYFSMNALTLSLWGLAFLLFARLLRVPAATLASTRGFAWLGGVLGVALLNKVDTLALGLGLALALLLCRRDLLRTRGPYLAAAIALACFAPHIAWQYANGWPTLEFIHNARTQKMAPQSLAQFAESQLLQFGPLAAPLWLLGFVRLLRVSWARPLGVTVGSVLLVIVLGDGKPYYVAPVFLPLFAAGACVLERMRRLRVPALVLLCAAGLLTMPLGRPVLPVAQFIRYQSALGMAPRGVGERQVLGPLPQFFADMHGWPELVATVTGVHAALPASTRERACIVAENYGQAGAIDMLGSDLPPALSGHNNYWLWGPRGCTGETAVVIGSDREKLMQTFTRVTLAATHRCTLCMPYESDKPIWIASGLRMPVETLWPKLKHYR